MTMQESTYSSLCEPLFESLRDCRSQKDEAFTNNIQTYRAFLNSLELQHKARKLDVEKLGEQIVEIENQIKDLEVEYERKNEELERLKANADKQRNVANLAKQKFTLPVEILINDRKTSIVLNKTIAQLDEDHHFLQEQLQHLEEDLSNVMVEFDRRNDVVNDFHDLVVEFKERYERSEASPRLSSREQSREPDEPSDKNEYQRSLDNESYGSERNMDYEASDTREGPENSS